MTYLEVEKRTNGEESEKACTAVEASRVVTIESFMIYRLCQTVCDIVVVVGCCVGYANMV